MTQLLMPNSVCVVPLSNYADTDGLSVNSIQYGRLTKDEDSDNIRVGRKFTLTDTLFKVGVYFRCPLTSSDVVRWYLTDSSHIRGKDIDVSGTYHIRTQVNCDDGHAVSLLDVGGIQDITSADTHGEGLIRSYVNDAWAAKQFDDSVVGIADTYCDALCDIMQTCNTLPRSFYADSASLLCDLNPNTRCAEYDRYLSADYPWKRRTYSKDFVKELTVCESVNGNMVTCDNDMLIDISPCEFADMCVSSGAMDIGPEWLLNARFDNIDWFLAGGVDCLRYEDMLTECIHRLDKSKITVFSDRNYFGFSPVTKFSSPLMVLCVGINELPTFNLEFIYILSKGNSNSITLLSCDISCDRRYLTERISQLMSQLSSLFDLCVREIRVYKNIYDELYMRIIGDKVYNLVIDLTIAAAASQAIGSILS